jgi:phosphoribosylaminoimidazolecarboxamide formyltransferase/IMP cyclohydrolase
MRALLSVYDKTGIVEFARALHDLGVTLVSSGGTASAIADAGIPVTDVADLTGVPAILDHRVVTLHPKVHGGLLADPTNPQHQADMDENGIEAFDLVVSNLYPFASDPSIELIDIGGPAMVRASAKNYAHVGIVTSPDQYETVLAELREHGRLTETTRRAFALDAFARTAAYDAAIVEWLQDGETLPHHLDLAGQTSAEEVGAGTLGGAGQHRLGRGHAGGGAPVPPPGAGGIDQLGPSHALTVARARRRI